MLNVKKYSAFIQKVNEGWGVLDATWWGSNWAQTERGAPEVEDFSGEPNRHLENHRDQGNSGFRRALWCRGGEGGAGLMVGALSNRHSRISVYRRWEGPGLGRDRLMSGWTRSGIDARHPLSDQRNGTCHGTDTSGLQSGRFCLNQHRGELQI